jgi:hypothetical protein
MSHRGGAFLEGDRAMPSRTPLLIAVLTSVAVVGLLLARRAGGTSHMRPQPDDDALDDALDQSFPASDPPSWSTGDATAASRVDAGR